MNIPEVQDRLHRLVLAWDYEDLWHRAEEGKGVYDVLQPVPTTFDSIAHYKRIFEPLVLEEFSAQMLRGVEEGQVMVPHAAVVATTRVAGDFLYVRLAVGADVASEFADNDLALITADNPDDDACRWHLHALAFAEGREGDASIRLRLLLSDASQAGNAQGRDRVRAMRAALVAPGSCWWLLRLMNTATITREWNALQHAHLMPFVDTLLCGGVAARRGGGGGGGDGQVMRIPPAMRNAMEAQCNTPQMKALEAGLDGTPMVLIQGPPGTGKTRTILNLLSVVMHAAKEGALELLAGGGGESAKLPPQPGDEAARRRLWALQSPWAVGAPLPRDAVKPSADVGAAHAGTDCFGLRAQAPATRVGAAAGPRARVLVCAPSNSALDEVVLRILNQGLLDSEGASYVPSVVRAGVNVHHSVASAALDTLVGTRMGGGQGAGESRDQLRLAVLSEASIVCSTLSFAGASLFQRLSSHFDVVVIDEAAQAVEPSVLVPFVMGCRQAFLVGDPEQLPATVISARATEYGYDGSLFRRLQMAGYPVHMLALQYRMHPAISAFPSSEFYGGRLLDGPDVLAATPPSWHAYGCFGPLAFHHVLGRETVPEGSSSLINQAEAAVALALYEQLLAVAPELEGSPSVAVISPYKAQEQQVSLLRRTFEEALGAEMARAVDINTIDGFQGREKEVVLFSCVRSTGPQPPKSGRRAGIGFVADERRINVGLTRARNGLMVIGNAASLAGDPHWRRLVESCLKRNVFYQPAAPYSEFVTQVVGGQQGPVPDSPQLRKRLGLDKPLPEPKGKASAQERKQTATAPRAASGTAAPAQAAAPQPSAGGRPGQSAAGASAQAGGGDGGDAAARPAARGKERKRGAAQQAASPQEPAAATAPVPAAAVKRKRSGKG